MRERKLLSLTLALALTASLTVPALAAAPADVTGKWCEKEVSALMDKGIVSGYADGTYRPDTAVTRGAVAKMAFLALRSSGSSIKESTKNSPFTDTKGTWAEQYIAPLTTIGVIVPSEYPNGFAQGENMSRLETAKLLVRAYLYSHQDETLPTDAELVFTDKDQISKADQPYVKMAIDLGIINGYSDGSFKPNASIQRSTSAAMISRGLESFGTISDAMTVLGQESIIGKIDDSKAVAPEIKNVEWVVKPCLKIECDSDYTYWEPVTEDGICSYYTVPNNKRQIFIDKNGNQHEFKDKLYVSQFVHGMAAAMDPITQKCGYIDFDGNWVIEPLYEGTGEVQMCYFNDGASGFYGFVDAPDGNCYAMNAETKEVELTRTDSDLDIDKTWGTPPEPSLPSGVELGDINQCTTGGLWVTTSMLGTGGMRQPCYGICNRNGRTIVAPTAMTSYGGDSLHGSYYSGTALDDCIVMKHQISARFDVINDIYDGNSGELLFSFYNTQEMADKKKGDYRFFRECNDRTAYGQGLFITSTTERENERIPEPVGYMSKTGEMVIDAVFEEATPFSNGYAWVKYEGLWGMIQLPNF